MSDITRPCSARVLQSWYLGKRALRMRLHAQDAKSQFHLTPHPTAYTAQWRLMQAELLLACSGLAAAAIVAGVVAQHLQLHPGDSPAQVRRALLGTATPDVVVGAASPEPGLLLYTNSTQADLESGGGMSSGAVVGVVVAAAVGES